MRACAIVYDGMDDATLVGSLSLLSLLLRTAPPTAAAAALTAKPPHALPLLLATVKQKQDKTVGCYFADALCDV